MEVHEIKITNQQELDELLEKLPKELAKSVKETVEHEVKDKFINRVAKFVKFYDRDDPVDSLIGMIAAKIIVDLDLSMKSAIHSLREHDASMSNRQLTKICALELVRLAQLLSVSTDEAEKELQDGESCE